MSDTIEQETKPAKAKKPRAKAKGKGKPAGKPKLLMIPIAEIDTTVCKLARTGLNAEVVERYAGMMKDGVAFPPIRIHGWPKCDRYIASDGGHRVESNKTLGKKSIQAEVFNHADESTAKEAALAEAAKSNVSHGLPRSLADLRSLIVHVLLNVMNGKESDRAVGEFCSCNRTTVAKVRHELIENGELTGDAVRDYSKNTSVIGRVTRVLPEPETGRAATTEKPVKAPPKEDQEWMNEGVDEQKEAEASERFEAIKEAVAGVEAEPLPEVLTEGATDEKGRRVPESLSPVFLARTRFRSIVGSGGRLFADVAELSKQFVGEGIQLNAVKIAMDDFTGNVSAAQPFVVCPSCEGTDELLQGCKCCSKRGWLTRLRYQQLTPDLKAKADGPWEYL